MIDTQQNKESGFTTSSTIPLVDKSVKNSRNMPSVVFIENVEDFAEKYGNEPLVEEINVYYSKFKYMEAQIVKHSDGVKSKIPDIEKAIEAVEYLEKKNNSEESENMKVDFMVSNNLWAKAEVPKTSTVALWLGADIMCEYTLDEAKVLLTKNLVNAKTTLSNNENDLDFIKDQITVCEVNIARVYNDSLKKKGQTK